MRAWLIRELTKAYYDARGGGKRKTRDEHLFEANLQQNIAYLADDILNRVYKPSRGIAFIVKLPVVREIFAAPFRDRVVHHFLYNMTADWWDRRMIYDSYACRKGKGTHFGVKRLSKMMRAASICYTKKVYVIKLDIQGYFMSLPRRRLFERIHRGLQQQFPEGGAKYRTINYLWKEIIFDDPTRGVIRRGRLRDWRHLPKSKSLFHQRPGRGIVIGNLSSQLLSNIYLDALDRFVKYELGYKYYGRYVDDFFFLVTEEQLPQAKQDIRAIEDFLAGLELTLHPKKRYIQPIEHGVPFLGAVVYPYRIVAGQRIVQNFRQAALLYGTASVKEGAILSYLGHMKHLNAKRTCQAVFDAVGWDWRY